MISTCAKGTTMLQDVLTLLGVWLHVAPHSAIRDVCLLPELNDFASGLGSAYFHVLTWCSISSWAHHLKFSL